jgi:hypothetical protein
MSTKALSFSSVEFENSIVPFATPVTRREFLIWQGKSYISSNLDTRSREYIEHCGYELKLDTPFNHRP